MCDDLRDEIDNLNEKIEGLEGDLDSVIYNYEKDIKKLKSELESKDLEIQDVKKEK